MLSATSWQLLAGGLTELPFAVLVEGAPPPMTASTLAGFAYVSVVATAVAYSASFAGLKHLPAGSVGLVGLLNPVAGVLLGIVIAHETLGRGRGRARREPDAAPAGAARPSQRDRIRHHHLSLQPEDPP